MPATGRYGIIPYPPTGVKQSDINTFTKRLSPQASVLTSPDTESQNSILNKLYPPVTESENTWVSYTQRHLVLDKLQSARQIPSPRNIHPQNRTIRSR